MFNVQYVQIWNLLEHYRKKILELRLIFIFTIFMTEIIISPPIVDDGCAHFHFHFSEVREKRKGRAVEGGSKREEMTEKKEDRQG